MKHYLAFDIGGTQIKYGIISEAGTIIWQGLADTEAHLGGLAIIDKVIHLGKGLLEMYSVQGVAISTAGQVNFQTGVIVGAGDTIPEYKGVDVKTRVSEALGLPVEVRNDVDCAALGEYWLGNHNSKNFIMLTIGTGIGGGIVIDGNLYSGHSFSAGEWGYMQIEGASFEKYASITGLIRMVEDVKGPHHWNGKNIFAQYDQGEAEIREAVGRFYKHLAIGISNLIYIFNPEKVIIGGGITARGEVFLDEVRSEILKYLLPHIYQNTSIVLAGLGNHAGLIGSVYNFMQNNREEGQIPISN